MGTINNYVLTDINGKAKTAIYQSYVTVSNWQNTGISDNTNSGNWPAVMAAYHYVTNGTQMGDWYIGSAGEYALMENMRQSWSIKMGLINAVYPNDCITAINIIGQDGCNIWTSTEADNDKNYVMKFGRGLFSVNNKDTKNQVIPLLQY